jgi:hypothetical protein
MFLAVGHPVLKIKRYQIGPIELGDLRPGQTRRLGKGDMERLKLWAEKGRRTGPAHANPRRGQGRDEPGGIDDVPLLKLDAGELAQG